MKSVSRESMVIPHILRYGRSVKGTSGKRDGLDGARISRVAITLHSKKQAKTSEEFCFNSSSVSIYFRVKTSKLNRALISNLSQYWEGSFISCSIIFLWNKIA
jgi:hypothetical protein